MNAVNFNQFQEISDDNTSDDETSGFANTTKFSMTKSLATNFQHHQKHQNTTRTHFEEEKSFELLHSART